MKKSSVRSRNKRFSVESSVRSEAAQILLGSIIRFLRAEHFDERSIRQCFNDARVSMRTKSRRGAESRLRTVLRVYEAMGAIIATWYSDPRFLDDAGNPAPLKASGTGRSIKSLVSATHVRVSYAVVVELMRQSPTIKLTDEDTMTPEGRVFFLPGFELLRAGLVVERFLDTLHRNSLPTAPTGLIFERCSYANQLKSGKLAQLLRDIRDRGSSFLDAVDGQMESNRSRTSGTKNSGELGVFMFAWMQNHEGRTRGTR